MMLALAGKLNAVTLLKLFSPFGCHAFAFN